MCTKFIILEAKIVIIFFNIVNKFVQYPRSIVIDYFRVHPVTANVFISDHSEFLTCF